MKMKFSFKYFVTVLFGIIIFFVIFSNSSRANEINTKKNILILNSYHKGYTWSDSIMNGIEDVLKTYDKNYSIYIEYMDTKTMYEEEYLSRLYLLYQYKYNSKKFDVVISTDDTAYEFLKKYYQKLFPNTPIVACAINDVDDFISYNRNTFTGVAETLDVKGTIDLAVKLFPYRNNLVVITDNSRTGEIVRDEIRILSAIYNKDLKINVIQDDKIQSVKSKLEKIGNDNIILQTAVFKDGNNELISYQRGNEIIYGIANSPMFSLWEALIDDKVLGGKVASGYSLGEMGAKKALMIFRGFNVKNIPFLDKSNTKYIINYNQLRRFGINTKDLPKSSSIINRPPSHIKISRDLVYSLVTIIVAVLIVLNVSLIANILNRRRAEKDLQKSEQLYRTFIELLPDAVFVRKVKGKLITANEAALKLVGCNNINDITNSNLGDIFEIHDDYKEIVEKGINKLIDEEIKIGFLEQKFISGDGNIIDVEVAASSFKHHGDKYIIAVVRDISERKRAEELQKEIIDKNMMLVEVKEYDKLKTQFFSTISHELKTPLNIILGIIQLIQLQNEEICMTQCNKNEYNKKYINIMKQNCYRLLRLINNLIDITKIDSGFIKINLQNYNIVKVIEDITLSISDYARTFSIEVIFDTNVEEKIMACDVDHIERIMLNLLSNAVKFTENGGYIEVNLFDYGDNIQISIKDTGVGIPESKLKEIFERFKQVDYVFTRRKEGSGIGLSLVKALVELHDGTIDVRSKIGEGSEFIIKLPVKLVDNYHGEVADTDDDKVERVNIEFSDIYS